MRALMESWQAGKRSIKTWSTPMFKGLGEEGPEVKTKKSHE